MRILRSMLSRVILYLRMTPQKLHIEGLKGWGKGLIPFVLSNPLYGDYCVSFEVRIDDKSPVGVSVCGKEDCSLEQFIQARLYLQRKRE